MIKRSIQDKLNIYLSKFPIVTLTGVRQCGKSTLIKNAFPDYNYVSLESPDARDFAINDPRGFLCSYKAPCIFDEVQRTPELFSYLQAIVDQENTAGRYILSGSHNFLLMQNVSQSLAGRTAVLTLAPLSIAELANEDALPDNTDALMLKGFYPALYSRNLSPDEYYPSYVQTYIERDVRLLRNIPNANDFIRFIKLLAIRSGSPINYTELSASCGISIPTVRAWISVLIQSYVVFELHPYYKNYSKRLIKAPKLYFYDTGLLCHFLGIESESQLNNHPMKGAVFETMVVSEYMKSRFFAAREPHGYYWRDTNQNEVDLLTEDSEGLKAYEIKSGTTMNRKYLQTLSKFASLSGISEKDISCVYSGNQSYYGENGNFIRYTEVW